MNSSTTEKNKGYFALLLTSVLWGTTWVASKNALKYLPGLQLSYLRQFIAGSFFLIYFIFFKRLPLPKPKEFKSLIIMSILMFVTANALSTWGLKYLPTGLAALIGALYPIIVVGIDWFLFKKRDLKKNTGQNSSTGRWCTTPKQQKKAGKYEKIFFYKNS